MPHIRNLALTILLISTPLVAQEAVPALEGQPTITSLSATVVEVEGEVIVLRPGAPDYVLVSTGETLPAGTDITTGLESEIRLTVSEGILLIIKELTDVRLTESFVVQQAGKADVPAAHLRVRTGRVRFGLIRDDAKQPQLRITTPRVTASVRGTAGEFFVSSDRGDSIFGTQDEFWVKGRIFAPLPTGVAARPEKERLATNGPAVAVSETVRRLPFLMQAGGSLASLELSDVLRLEAQTQQRGVLVRSGRRTTTFFRDIINPHGLPTPGAIELMPIVDTLILDHMVNILPDGSTETESTIQARLFASTNEADITGSGANNNDPILTEPGIASTAGVIDDFNRSNSLTIGNGWNEFLVDGGVAGSEVWQIFNNRAFSNIPVFSPPDTFVFMTKDIGHLATFDIQATFAISDAGSMEVFLGVNSSQTAGVNVGDTDFGLEVLYQNGNIELSRQDIIIATGSGLPIFTGFAPFIIRARFDGSQLCGKIWDATGTEPSSFQLCTSTTDVPVGQTHVRVEAGSTSASTQGVEVDDVIRN